MKQTPDRKARNRKKSEAQAIEPDTSPGGEVYDQLAGFWLRVGRFWSDVLGVLLMALALMTLLGMLGLTRGAFISPWIALIQRWLGWGAFLVVLTAAGAGIASIRHHFSQAPFVGLGRILALEGLAFTLLALMALWGGRTLEQAEQGNGGGLIGWGLVELFGTFLPETWIAVVLLLLLALLAASAFGLAGPLERRIDAWLLEDRSEEGSARNGEAFQPSETNLLDEEDDEVFETAPPPTPPGAGKGSISPTARDSDLPPLNLLLQDRSTKPDEAEHHQTADLIKQTLAEFGIPAEVRGYRVGPTVTQYAVEPGYIEKVGPDGKAGWHKVRVSQISALARDLALALSAERLRIEAPVPGQSFVGIEVPNEHGSVVRLRGLMESDAFQRLASPLAVALGKDVSGQAVVADLAR
ncbi:MAG: DNA translocase FtsK, partial [Anaerolineaceae bacterium]